MINYDVYAIVCNTINKSILAIYDALISGEWNEMNAIQ